ncbi:MAG: EAL domain-containing protein [Solirubrobacteraceae bacterium]
MVDDFGTGYTSIGQLALLPADVLKIDRIFSVSEDPRQRNLVRLMIEAAHAFELRVVAEGMEEEHTCKRCATWTATPPRDTSSPDQCPPTRSRPG